MPVNHLRHVKADFGKTLARRVAGQKILCQIWFRAVRRLMGQIPLAREEPGRSS
jgi:hypothetical protein